MKHRFIPLLNLYYDFHVIGLVLQVGIDVMHLCRLHVRSETLSILVAAQCLLLWLKIQYFARSVRKLSLSTCGNTTHLLPTTSPPSPVLPQLPSCLQHTSFLHQLYHMLDWVAGCLDVAFAFIPGFAVS